MEAVHLSTFDTVQCKNELLARALGSKRSIYIGDMVLNYDGTLRAFKLKPYHVPTTLTGQVEALANATCEDYLQQAIRLGTYHKIGAVFPSQHLYDDFDEVELGASSWQPKLDAIQEQIDDLDSTYAQDAEVVAAFATQIAAAGDVFNLVESKVGEEKTRAEAAELTLTQAVAAGAATQAEHQTSIDQLNDQVYVYVDSKRTDNYVESGTLAKPYKNLTAAFVKLADAETDTVIFQLATGEYTGVHNLTKTSQNQSFALVGSGEATYVQGASSWAAVTDHDLLKLTNFLDVRLENLTVRYSGKYAFYPHTCRKVTLQNVHFENCAASDHGALYEYTTPQATRTALWDAMVEVKNGGICRIRNCQDVIIDNCSATKCMRGFRIQDCHRGKVTNNVCDRIVDNAYYLASGPYNGTAGCNNFYVANNKSSKCFHNSYLVIGGSANVIQGNVADGGSGAGIQLFATVDCIVKNNSVIDCCKQAYNGYGGQSDSAASISSGPGSGGDQIQGGSYLAVISSNSVYQAGVGTDMVSTAIRVTNSAYPTACNKVYLTDNYSDAAVHQVVDHLAVVSSRVQIQTALDSKAGLLGAVFTGDVSLKNKSLSFQNAEQSNSITLQPPSSMTTSTTYTLPQCPDSDKVLQSDSMGVLSWVVSDSVAKTVIVITPGTAASPNQITADTADVVYLNTAPGHFELPQTGTSAVSLSIAVRNLKASSRVYAHDSAGADQLYKNDSNTAIIYDTIDGNKVEVFHYDHNTQQWRYVD